MTKIQSYFGRDRQSDSFKLSDCYGEQSDRRRAKRISTPFRFLMVTAASIFVAEGFVMFLLPLLPPLYYYMEALLDAFLLTVLVFPALYFFLFRPMVLHIARYKEAQEKLQKAHDELEVEVAQRTAALTATNEALRESEERFRSVAQSAIDAIIVASSTGNIILWNNAAQTIFGYGEEEVLSKRVTLLIPERFHDALRRGLDRFFSTGKSDAVGKTVEYVGRKKDGSEFPLELSLASWKSGEGIFFTGIIRDITDHRKKERQIKETKDYLESIITTTADAIITTDLEGKVVSWNAGAEKLYGWHAEEAVGKRMPWVPEELRQEAQEIIDRVKKGEPVINYETKRRRKDGTVVDVATTVSPLRNADGKIVGVTGIVRDVTEQKKLEEVLLKAERQFRLVWENSADGMRLTNKEGTIVLVNNAFSQIVGKERSELEGQSVGVTYHQEPHEHIVRRYQERFKSRTVEKYFEREIVLWNGKKIWLGVANSFLEFDGQPPLLLGIFRDITERKRAEEALRQAEQKYRSIFDNAVDGIFQTTPDGRYLTANPALARIYGYESPEQLLETVNDLNRQFYVEPGRREEFICLMREHGALSGFESQVYCKDGSVIWISENARAIRDDSGTILHYEGTTVDITKRKHAEEALKEAEARYRMLFERVPVGLYRSTPTGEILDGNPAIVQMLGYPDKETYLKVNAVDLYVNSEERKEWKMLINNQEVVRNFEEQVRQRDGTVIWVQDNTRAVRDASGQVVYYEGILQEITQRKKMEEERENLIVELRDALANIKTLSGLVPICASCKKIRDDKGYWNHLEQYIMDHSGATLSHGICPDCAKQLYPEFFDKK